MNYKFEYNRWIDNKLLIPYQTMISFFTPLDHEFVHDLSNPIRIFTTKWIITLPSLQSSSSSSSFLHLPPFESFLKRHSFSRGNFSIEKENERMFFLYPFFIKLLRIEPFCCECSHPTDSWEPSEELPAHSQRRCMRIRCFCPVLIHSSFYSRELVKDKVFPLDNRVVFRVTYFHSSFPFIHCFSTV